MRVHPPGAEVRVVGPPTVEATLTITARDIDPELASFALWPLGHGEVTPDAVVSARIAREITGSSLVGVDEVTVRYLERLTRTAQGNPAGCSQEKK